MNLTKVKIEYKKVPNTRFEEVVDHISAINKILERPLKFEELSIGMKVKDTDNIIGTIIDCSDIHNVFVQFTKGRSSLSCLDLECSERHPHDTIYWI